jgi:hypothetical protein
MLDFVSQRYSTGKRNSKRDEHQHQQQKPTAETLRSPCDNGLPSGFQELLSTVSRQWIRFIYVSHKINNLDPSTFMIRLCSKFGTKLYQASTRKSQQL